MTKQMKYIRLASTVFTVVLCAVPAFGANRDIIQLQTQVQQLQDAVARLQQSNDERMGVMKDLVQQNSDQVNKMAGTMETLSHTLQTQNEGQGGKLDQLSGQIQALNDSLDEIKARLGKLETLTQGIQNQQQTITAPANSSPAPSAAPDNTPPPNATQEPLPPTPPTDRRGKPSAGIPLSDATPPSGGAAPVGDLYKSALGDYMAAKYSLAAGEFSDVIKNYPDQALSGNSFYYLGEIDYRAGKYEDAVKDYDMVLQHFPDNNKVPASRLHKGQAYFALKQNDAGVREMRALIQRFPNAPEAMLARSKLSGMGITVSPRHSSAQ